MSTYLNTAPHYGYSTVIDLALHKATLSNGKVAWFDDGATYDIRKFSGTWSLNAVDTTATLSSFYANRGVDVAFSNISGFHPFGPDLRADCTGSVQDISFSGVQQSPYLYNDIDADILYRSSSSYTPPGKATQGSFIIADTSNLEQPQDLYNRTQDWATAPQVTQSGRVDLSDLGINGDHNTFQFTIQGCQGNIAALIEDLRTVRGGVFNIRGCLDGTAVITQPVKLYDRQLKIKHHGYNRYTLTMSVQKQ